MPRVCVFDVIETMLDLRALDLHFQRICGDAAARQEWFQQLLQSALVATLTTPFQKLRPKPQPHLDQLALEGRQLVRGQV